MWLLGTVILWRRTFFVFHRGENKIIQMLETWEWVNNDRIFILRWTIPWSNTQNCFLFYYIFIKETVKENASASVLSPHPLPFWSRQSLFPIGMRQFGCPNRSATLISPHSPMSVWSQCHRTLEERVSSLSRRPQKMHPFFSLVYPSHKAAFTLAQKKQVFLLTSDTDQN